MSQKQTSILSFFGKPSQSPASTTAATLPSPPLSNKKKAAAVKAEPQSSPAAHKASLVKRGTSDSPKIPSKRMVLSDDSDEEESVKPPVKRKVSDTTIEEKTVLDTTAEETPKGRGRLSRGKPKYEEEPASDSDDDEESDVYIQSDQDDAESLDDFIVADESASEEEEEPEEPPAKTPSKPFSKPKSAASAYATPSKPTFPSRPKAVSTPSNTGGFRSVVTQAEAARLKAKAQKEASEQVFEFLLDIKDADGHRPTDEGYDPRTLYIPKRAWNSFTPFERQFWEIKQNHYDTVLFFQKGKFFELYEDDAMIGHREFDLKLTDRVKMKMVGVPEASLEFWTSKFLARGYKVGRVDQCETALGAEMRLKEAKSSKGKEIVRRELRTVLTSGTIVDGKMLTDDLASHCIAIKEHIADTHSLPVFGLCILDAATAEFRLSHFEDDVCRTQLETVLRQLRPKEIIHEKGNLSVATLRVMRNCCNIGCQWTALKEGTEFFSAEDSTREVEKLLTVESTGVLDVPAVIDAFRDKTTTMSALGGMVSYLRQLNLDKELLTTRHFSAYDPLSNGESLILDGQTLAHIEVLQNSQGGTEGTLLQLLSRCVTPFGKRLFKQWVCAPLRSAKAINERLDVVEQLLNNSAFVAKFDAFAKRLPDLERLLSRIHAGTCRKHEFLKVITGFETIISGFKSLLALLQDSESTNDTLKTMIESAPQIGEHLDTIKSMYTHENNDLLPLKGAFEEYDATQQELENTEAQLEEALEKYKVLLKSNALIFRDIGTKDIYQVQVPAAVVKGGKIPTSWTKMSLTKEFTRYYTPETTKLIQHLKETRERRTTALQSFQGRLYASFDSRYALYMGVVDVIAQIDSLVSLAKSSAGLGEPCVRPEIIESETALVSFEELRHPCIMAGGAVDDFIPNDIALGSGVEAGEKERLILLTGPNMAGKSTLLRMTCIGVIMAQMGCYVPAKSARISPIDAIYSRMGANDIIFSNASTFKVELDDCNKILTRATPKSLVILDELGRGTSTHDGMAIAYAVLHRLATYVNCIGFFATHFTSLTDDYKTHPNVKLCHMLTHVGKEDDGEERITFLYKLVAGTSPKSYGPHVARMAGLSSALVDRASAVSQRFSEETKKKEEQRVKHRNLELESDLSFLLQLLATKKNVLSKTQTEHALDIITSNIKANRYVL